MRTYLFYDIETTGLNKAFDQVLRFAAIRTDLQLNEIERHEISVRLRPDVVMSPRALITHQISIAEAHQGHVEYEATQRIHQLLNTPDTISVGYNSLGFDDEFLRFSFHRNLLPPYTHQYNNGCGRMDMLPFAVIYRLYKEEVLRWPTHEGKPSLKLELINELNDLTQGRSHDAMADVEATVALAALFRNETAVWEFLAGYFDKKVDAARMSDLTVAFQTASGNHLKGLLVSSDVGSDLGYQAPVLFIGNSIPYSNQGLWLRIDQPELQQVTPDSIEENTWAVRKRLGEPPFILPPRKRFLNHFSSERLEIVKSNLVWIVENDLLFQKVIAFHQAFRYPEIPNIDEDAALYQMGFLTKAEEKYCQRFHTAPVSEKATLVDGFQRNEISTLASRILYRNYLENLPERLHPGFATYMEKVHPEQQTSAMVDYRGTYRTTPTDALKEIEVLTKDPSIDAHQQHLLQELADHIQKQFFVTK